MAKLLTRTEFREGVFERDSHKCVLCGNPAQDAHHIIERRLFDNGGYYLENGASVCGPCHINCEKTHISVEAVRDAAGITTVVVPDQMYPDHKYDKWGNHILQNGLRTKGPLFHDESVQKILGQAKKLHLFTNKVKYPRTFHVPWSECVHSDDKVSKWMHNFKGRRVIVTEKMDGENTTLMSDYYHARSVESNNHPSRNIAKALHSQFAHDIPEDWRVCCENMYAEHSIKYNNLESYLYGFSIWNERNIALSWDETQEWFKLLGIVSVPVLYDGIYDEDIIKRLWDNMDPESQEGYVIRIADSFHYGEFHKWVAKMVRDNHIQTAKHWMHGQRVVPNELADGVNIFDKEKDNE